MSQPAATDKKKPTGYVDRWYHAKLWHGFEFFTWMRLLIRNRFAVGWHMVPAAFIITMFSILHSFLRGVQWLLLGIPLSRAKVEKPPVFIIGHWRSGTTLLHELMVLDERHIYPDSYQCFAPNHFLISEWVATRLFGFLMPKQRPMDNMAMGWKRPQEDEFALCALGQPSPYWTIAFPNHPPQFQEYLDLKQVPPKAVASWQRTLLRFMRHLSFRRSDKRLILKSPTHTARVRVLLDLFPNARFIHIVRDPYTVYASTVNLWKKMYQAQGLQRPKFEGLEEYVFNTFLQMYDAFEGDRHLLNDSQFYEIRYEDLVADPVGQLRAIYQQLDLGDIQPALPAIEQYLEETGDYKTNRYQITDELRAQVTHRWARYIQQFGYRDAETTAQASSNGGGNTDNKDAPAA